LVHRDHARRARGAFRVPPDMRRPPRREKTTANERPDATRDRRAARLRPAAQCGAGEFYAGGAALPFELIRSFGFGDGAGWSFEEYARAEAAKPDEVLREVLCLAAAEAEARVLCAEGRAILVNAVFLALGNGWRARRAGRASSCP
jgi:hypothetical protein